MEPSEPKKIEVENVIADEMVPDIDSVDCNNAPAVLDCAEEIYSFYRKMEEHSCVSADYMSNQFDINDNMRAVLIDWIIEEHYQLELLDETLYLTINIIDRFLAQQSVGREQLQLVGVTAMLLACKYEEVSVPPVDDFIFITDRICNRKQVLHMEKMIIYTLGFNLSFPTPYVFMRRFLKAANSDKELELLSYFLVELSLVEYVVLKFRPSLLAAAAIYTALSTLRGKNQWNMIMEFYTCYTEEQLQECSKMMVEFHHSAGAGELTATFRKYRSIRFGFASKSILVLFVLDQKSLNVATTQ